MSSVFKMAQLAIVVSFNMVAGSAQAQAMLQEGVDRSGFYLGLQVGREQTGGNRFTVEDRTTTGGMFAGYDYQIPTSDLVLGFEVELSHSSKAGITGSAFNTNLRGGYIVGNGMAYVKGGFANVHLKTNGVTTEINGSVFAIGYEQPVSDHITIGGEYVRYTFENVGNRAFDVDTNGVKLRAAYRF